MWLKLGDNVNLHVKFTEQMKKDYADCKRCAAKPGPGKGCDSCSLDVDLFGSALCELPSITEVLDNDV